MKKQPPFPEIFNGFSICWGHGNKAVGPNLVGHIILNHDAYYEQKQKEYEEAKALYEQSVFVDTVFCGNTSASGRITKIVISEEKQYVCWKASHEFQKTMDNQNADAVANGMKTNYHIKPGRFSLTAFLSMIKNGNVRIISTPAST